LTGNSLLDCVIASEAVPERATLEPSVSVLVVVNLLGAVEQAGVTRERFLRAAGLEASQLEVQGARMPRSQAHKLCALALELTGDPALGLHWAERVNEGSFAPLSHIMAHSATLRQAFESLAQLHRLVSDRPSFQLVERHDKATLRALVNGETLTVRRFSAEMAVSGFYHLLGRAGAHALPDLVSFEYPAPAYHHEYARIFHATVLFQQAFTGVVFERALLDAPVLRKDADVHEVLKALAERRLQRLTRNTPFGVQVREFLVQERKGQRTPMEEVARALHISERSLRRRLATEGKPYNEIADEALAAVAKPLLRDGGRSIQETAYELGFASFSAFHRAFRRATGTTPSAFRASLSDDDAR
jgi:AraC-like DNA-binding protein